MIFNIIYIAFTLLVPAWQTYSLLKSENHTDQQSLLWSIYWAFYSIIYLIMSVMPFLKIQTFQIVIMLFLIWLYHSEYKGSLVLKYELMELLQQNQIVGKILQSLKQWNQTFSILENQNTKDKET